LATWSPARSAPKLKSFATPLRVRYERSQTPSNWGRALAGLTRTMAGLRIIGDDLNPSEITRLLGAEPTAYARKGDTRRTTTGREIAARSGSWQLRVEMEPGDLNGQIGAILAKLTDNLSIWCELGRRYRCDVFCGLFMRNSNEGADLEPGILKMLGDRGLRLGLDIYGPPD
jgi:hypothetical protein